jgi:uncharacterized protein (DUF2252 family)
LHLRRLPHRQPRPLASAGDDVDTHIRDLDQTVIGNPVHDLIGFALSLDSAAPGWKLSGKVTSTMLENLIVGYQSAFPCDDEEPVKIRSPTPSASGLRQLWRAR